MPGPFAILKTLHLPLSTTLPAWIKGRGGRGLSCTPGLTAVGPAVDRAGDRAAEKPEMEVGLLV